MDEEEQEEPGEPSRKMRRADAKPCTSEQAQRGSRSGTDTKMDDRGRNKSSTKTG